MHLWTSHGCLWSRLICCGLPLAAQLSCIWTLGQSVESRHGLECLAIRRQRIPAPLQEVDFQTLDAKHNGRKGSTGLVDIHKDLPKAVEGIFHGTAAQRKAVIQDLYAEVR